MKIVKFASVSLVFFCIVPSIWGQAFFANPRDVNSLSYFSLSGSFGGLVLPDENSQISMRIDLDENAATATFRSVFVEIDGTINLNRSFSVGGENITIRGSITFDDSIEFANAAQPIPLTRRENGFALAESDFRSDLQTTEQNQLRVQYSISGPTQRVESETSISPNWQRWISGGNVAIFDTSDSPHAITLGGDNLYFGMGMEQHNIFSERIDGVDLSMDLRLAYFGSPSQMRLIPEASSYWTMALILMGFVAFHRKSNSQKT